MIDHRRRDRRVCGAVYVAIITIVSTILCVMLESQYARMAFGIVDILVVLLTLNYCVVHPELWSHHCERDEHLSTPLSSSPTSLHQADATDVYSPPASLYRSSIHTNNLLCDRVVMKSSPPRRCIQPATATRHPSCVAPRTRHRNEH